MKSLLDIVRSLPDPFKEVEECTEHANLPYIQLLRKGLDLGEEYKNELIDKETINIAKAAV